MAFLVWNSNRSAVKRQQWMDTLTWVYESATSEDRVQMPYAVAIPILGALLEQARGSLEEQMVRGVTKMLLDRRGREATVADDSTPPQYTVGDLDQLDELLAEADRRIEKSKAAEAKPSWRRLLRL